MTFPQTPLEIKGEILINGVWTDVTSYIRKSGINITRGKPSEQSRISAATCNFTLNNRDGRFSNRNPNSPYFGLIPRNTPVRISSGVSSPYLKAIATEYTGATATNTTDKAALDIVGDIDIAFDINPTKWVDGRSRIVATKYVTSGNQRSWFITITESGRIRFSWTPDGTAASRIFVNSSVSIPANTGRLSIRVNLDVNNGASGNTTTFYTSTTGVGGSWTQLGTAVTLAGTTSIFASTAPVEIGTANNAQFNALTTDNFGGRFYELQIKNSANTVVANPKFYNQAVGTTSFSDGLGNTWNVGTPSKITSDVVQFTGELSELPVRWDKTGKDVWVPITASGILRRLTSGAEVVESPVFKNLKQYTGAGGYWSFEDEERSTRAASFIARTAPATIRNVTFAPDSTFPASAGTLTLNDATSRVTGTVGTPNAFFAKGFAMMYFKRASIPSVTTTVAEFYTAGSISRFTIGVSTNSYVLTGYDSDGNVIPAAGATIAWSAANSPDNWVAIRILLTQVSSSTQIEFAWFGLNGFLEGITYTSTLSSFRRFTGFQLLGANGNDNTKYAHIILAPFDIPFTGASFQNSSLSYVGETAATRIARVAAEEGVTTYVYGSPNASEVMGPQGVDTLANIIFDCLNVDQGLLYEPKDELALAYRTRADLYDQKALEISYPDSILSEVPTPTEDDLNIVNDLTVTRPTGSSARATKEDGPLSVQASPLGIGRYVSSLSLNVGYDSQLADLANFIVFKATIDEARYPQVKFNHARKALVNNQELADRLNQLDIGDYYVLTDLPSFLPPSDVKQLIQGISMTLDTYEWTVTLNSSPYAAYDTTIFITGLEQAADASSDLTQVNTAFNSTATSISVKTLSGPLIDTAAANYPLDIVVAGEVMTVTAVSGSTSPQTLTVTRSVNGIVKAHSANEPIYLNNPIYVAF